MDVRRLLPIAMALGILGPVGKTPAIADDPPRPLAEWVQTDPPRIMDERHLAANHGEREWTVKMSEGRVVATRFDHGRSKKIFPYEPHEKLNGEASFLPSANFTQVDDGWIASFNNGEWGGSVWWFSPDGRREYRITEVNSDGFLATKNGLFLLEGLAHLSSHKGYLRRLNKGAEGRWIAEPFADLGDVPHVATLDGDDAALIACSGSLCRVDLKTKKVEKLVLKAFWSMLYPNSIVCDPAGPVWIGMRHGVARIDGIKPNPTIRWCLPDQATADERVKPDSR